VERPSWYSFDTVSVRDVELTMKEFSGTEGFNQLLKPATF